MAFIFISWSCAAQDLGKVISSKGVTEQVIRHTNYTVSFNGKLNLPNWVSWNISENKLLQKVSRKDYSFASDPMVNGTAVTPMDYSRSGYDRGHMCPAADNKWDSKAMEESFYMTNICPQNHTLNEKTWASLENACRSWAHSGDVYIVCGPYFEGKPKTHIGNNRVAVPDFFWKVVLRNYRGKWYGIGFLIPNKAVDNDFRAYIKTIDDIELLTGLDFFSDLDDKAEEQAEARVDASKWIR